jgi:CheY-like chemotaxis protein
MQALLDTWGCLTCAVRGAAEALAMLAQHDRAPDLLLCDYHLEAGENGIETIRRIQAAFESSMPAILVTADASPEVLRAAAERQYPVLRKPVAPAKLRALLNRLLAKPSSGRSTETCQELG